MGLFSGIGGLIGGVFGATQQKRAFNSAIENLRNFQQNTLLPEAGKYSAFSGDMVARGLNTIGGGTLSYNYSPEVQGMRDRLIASTQGGLSPAAQIALEDANKFLKEDAVSTGNLRSGAFGYAQAELAGAWWRMNLGGKRISSISLAARISP
ncbi:hypothetical protein YTPLAS18_16970 [Nitrospira sp.]|nr:hypothetical protein YTPLAS18_16970 [Nitrospira sp.]